MMYVKCCLVLHKNCQKFCGRKGISNIESNALLIGANKSNYESRKHNQSIFLFLSPFEILAFLCFKDKMAREYKVAVQLLMK